ncbi:MAG TPA: type II secretion system F family protein, partial [Candidatus Ozemobacteraceae bacterium]|nr:type II secretion system F family protein [Candidatus Ozemobacteraceae bacterium]
LVLSSAVTFGILTFIVPRFKDIYKRFGSELPWLTQTTISLSDLMVSHFLLFFGGTVATLFLLAALKRTESGKRVFDRLLLAVPVIGHMYHLYEIASFSKSFSILLHSGITVTTALDIIVPGIDLQPVRERIQAANSEIRNGRPMGESFALQEPLLPDLLNRMVLVGERTGNLTEMLDHVAEFYEEEFYNQVERLASLIEPMLIVFLGVIIGGIVISLYLPIFGMAKLIARR